MRFLNRKEPHLKNGGAPIILPKNDRNCGTALVLFFWLRRCHYWAESAFLLGELAVQCRTTNVSWLFEKTSHGLRYECLILALWGNGDEKIGGWIANKRPKNCPPIFLASFADSKFDADYDFAVKHDPIQSDDWVMESCLNRVGSQK